MRLWSIHPGYLDWKGLGALWRESLLAQAVLQGRTKGWKGHPQLDRFKGHKSPVSTIGSYLLAILEESRRRGYNYDGSKIDEPRESVEAIPITEGQLVYELKILMERLEERAPERFEQLKCMNIDVPMPNPVFRVVEGDVEIWEKSFWRLQRDIENAR
jgi:hypothetical protein